MSQAGTINHDTAARLLGIAPGELESLVKSGAVRRSDRNAYLIHVLVQDYIGHLKAERDRAELAPKQSVIAEHVDLSERAVRDLLDDVGIDHKLSTLTEIRVAYIRRLREQAAGRFASGDLDLATERARLAKEQADKIAMQNAQARRELAPVVLITEVLAKAGTRVAGILEAIPGQVKRRLPDLPATEIEAIQREIAKARNICAAIRLDDLDDDPADSDLESKGEDFVEA